MKKFFLFITAILLFAGCAKEQFVEERSYSGPVTVVSATFESLGDDATKAAVADAGTFTWQNGDKAAFTAAAGSSYCTGTNSKNDATADFTINGDLTFNANSFAFYPSDLITGQYTSSLKVKVPGTREWKDAQTNVAMYGTKDNDGPNTFRFTHMGGLVRVKINYVPTNARKFVFKTRGYKINGEFDVINESSCKVIKTAPSNTESEQTDTLTWTTAPELENTMYFYIPLPTGKYENGFAFSLLDQNGAELISKTASQSVEIKRKDLILMPAITLAGGFIEPAEKAAVVQEVPAGHDGDFLLANSEKVLLKINSDAAGEQKDINLKYDEGTVPTELEIQVVGENTFTKTLSGNLPYTHVDFTQGEIANVEMTTSASTFAVIYPAEIYEKLTVTGGNVVLQGATVNMIEVAEGAVADKKSNSPVVITMENYDVSDGEAKGPEVKGSIVAKADVKVAPVSGQTVAVVKVGDVTVEDTGAGEVDENDNEVPVSTFEDFKSAIDNIVAGQTIKVTKNITDAKGITVAEDKNFTVDFGTHTYTCASEPAGSTNTRNQVFQLLKNSTITFKNGTIDVAESAKSQFRFIIQNYANLTLEDMTLDGTNLAVNSSKVNYTVSNNNGTVAFTGKTNIKAAASKGIAFDVYDKPEYTGVPTVTVNTTGTIEGQVEVTGGKLVVDNGTFIHSGEVLKVSSGNVTVNEGKFEADNVAVWVEGKNGKTAEVTLAGGTFESQESTVVFRGENDKITITGGNYTSKDNAVIAGNGTGDRSSGNTVTISGGTFNGNIKTSGYIACGIYAPWKDNITVNGGTFNVTNGAGVVARAGVVTINNGTFTCSGDGTGWVGDNKNQIPCKCLVFDAAANYPGKDENSKIVVNGGTFSDMSGVNYVADNGKYKLANNVELSDILTISSGKKFDIDLCGYSLTGRTNITHGNVTFANGTIQGATGNVDSKYKQALNVYGSSESSVDNYSVVKVASNAAVKAEVFGVCLFGPTAGANVGYGAGIDIEGTVTTTNESSSNEGAVFVSGNLGGSQEANTQTAMEGKNFVKISGTVTSASDAALALNGSATATITGKLTGNTGIAAKRGKLIVESGAVITGNGTCKGAPASNGNGTELTGSAVSASSTYGAQLSIDLKGGTYTSKAYTILNNANDSACNFNISGGDYTTTKENDGIVVYARLGSVNITGGTFTNDSNSEATLHVGCPTVGNLQPKLTISGASTVVKNEAEGTYTHKTNWRPLTVNMANELTYKAVEISGGTFHGQKPDVDDSWATDNTNKCFLATNAEVTSDGDNVWKVTLK